MSEIRSALVWEGGKEGISPLTVTLQEVKVQKKCLLLALMCEGEGGGTSPGLPAGYLCESMVGWFYNELLLWCRKKPEGTITELEKLLRKQWKRSMKELQVHGKRRTEEETIMVSGILFYGNCFVAFGNKGVYVLNRRFHRPRKKNILPGERGISFQTGEVRSFFSFYLESAKMAEAIETETVLESFYTESFMEEDKLERRLTELGKVGVEWRNTPGTA